MAENQKPATLEEAIHQLVTAWNVVHEFPEGPRLLHRVFGHVLPGGKNTGGHSMASRMDGTARRFTEEERTVAIPKEIALIRGEIKQAERRALGLEE